MNSINNPNDSMPKDVIDTLEKIQGRFPGARRAHAKGLFFEATFTPNGNAIAYTTAAHLQKEAVSNCPVFEQSTKPDSIRFSFTF
ncbi:hypothetical protein [Psychrobacillus sp. NPDC093180]|uniref:hypothetical protein n=1 Tax=Psychrobacillus sp. NPDC093180 TaxID=3364489 RepID=UPI003819F7EB